MLPRTLLVAALLQGCSSEGFVPISEETALESRRTRFLSWNPFPTADYALWRERVTDVAYELKIWRAYRVDRHEWVPETLVYSRSGLGTPGHEVEIPLEAEETFVWAVRARFRLDGEWRVSPWSSATGWDRQADLPERGYATFSTGPR